MSDITDNPELLRATLSTSRNIAVVGMSSKTLRPSHGVARYMQAHGYRILPVNPTYVGTYILEEYCYSTLTEAAAALAKQGQKIDIVDCFRQSEAIGPIADEAISIGARCLWLQLGVMNPAATEKAIAAGLQVVVDRCIKIEHMQLI